MRIRSITLMVVVRYTVSLRGSQDAVAHTLWCDLGQDVAIITVLSVSLSPPFDLDNNVCWGG